MNIKIETLTKFFRMGIKRHIFGETVTWKFFFGWDGRSSPRK